MLCEIDKDFRPIYNYFNEFKSKVLKSADTAPLIIALERNGGFVYRFETIVYSDGIHDIENSTFAERLIKTLLWTIGGFKLYIHCPKALFDRLERIFGKGGKRDFDVGFMQKIYEKPFCLEYRDANSVPLAYEKPVKIGGNINGCRIGFDAGGSDRKVSAVINGNVVYSEEAVWHPKLHSDWRYHYDGIRDSLKKAAEFLPRIDSVGISSAGIYINNRAMAASLFIKVPDGDFDAHIKDIYVNIAKEFNAPVEVANDGDVAALAGAMELSKNRLLGVAMGTSQAAGYIDPAGNIKGWLNELAFVPVDMQREATVDEWSGDKGCGVKYFSQDAVIKLAQAAKIAVPEKLSPAEKLSYIQNLYDKKTAVKAIFSDIGVYLGYSILFYSMFYDIDTVLLLGRVSSGPGGNAILKKALEILAEHNSPIKITLPDESNRRVGQAIAAASLPKI